MVPSPVGAMTTMIDFLIALFVAANLVLLGEPDKARWVLRQEF
jgi:hypothetical protein